MVQQNYAVLTLNSKHFVAFVTLETFITVTVFNVSPQITGVSKFLMTDITLRLLLVVCGGDMSLQRQSVAEQLITLVTPTRKTTSLTLHPQYIQFVIIV